MVGVPGKYKGCETCRRRRVKVSLHPCCRQHWRIRGKKTLTSPLKCTNERPFCSKCTSSGRQCEGYERERVFITGTPETKGRVASHPKKGTPPKKHKARAEGEPRPDLVPLQPLTSAWDDFISLSSHGIEYSLLTTALQTKLASVSREEPGEDEMASGFSVALPPYVPLELQPAMAHTEFDTRAQCLTQLAGNEDGDEATESYCVYLFEVSTIRFSPRNWLLMGSDAAKLCHCARPGHLTVEAYCRSDESGEETWSRPLQRLSEPPLLCPRPSSHGGKSPRTYQNFRFMLFKALINCKQLSLALLSRRDTFLSGPDWTTIPWEQHPKCMLDQLFDIILFLPSIFARTDRLVPLQATLDRRLKAQDLLHSCLAIEAQLRQWLQQASMNDGAQSPAYWAEELVSPGTEIPFANAYTFRDGITGLQFLYYWMAQIPFHRCIDTLYRTIFQPVVDSFPNMWPDLPASLQIDPTLYQQGRELAANICRGLDSTLNNTVQPDMLLAPMTVALDVYREINATSQDGVLELMWLEAFKGRLSAKGQHVASVIQSQRWMEVANY